MQMLQILTTIQDISGQVDYLSLNKSNNMKKPDATNFKVILYFQVGFV